MDTNYKARHIFEIMFLVFWLSVIRVQAADYYVSLLEMIQTRVFHQGRHGRQLTR